MSIILQKPKILCDSNGNFKSWNYLKYKIFHDRIQSASDIISLPSALVLCSLVSFILARNLVRTAQ